MINIVNILNTYLMNNQFILIDKTTPHLVTNIKLVKCGDTPHLLINQGSLVDFELTLSQDGRFVNVGDKITNYQTVIDLDGWSAANLTSLLNLMRNLGLTKLQWITLTNLMIK